MKVHFFRLFTTTAFVAVVVCAVAVAQNTTSAEIEEWKVAAAKGEAWAQYNLGWAYEYGRGVVENKQEAVRWYRKAAKQGDADAQYNLGFAYEYGAGVAEDKREAVRWYRKAAKQGNALAQLGLGFAYEHGEGVAEDKREAVRWYRKAAEQGDALAQSNLGAAYDYGEGVVEDKREAAHWYRKAAEQGNADAQSALGTAYKAGFGVAKDSREAVRWWRKAAEQGNAEAQLNLGWAYSDGEGVIADERESYIWHLIANASGDATVQALQESLDDKNWRNSLPQSEIPSARREAAQRMEEIERRKDGPDESTEKSAPKGDSPAAFVFENTWRSVVVVHNGRNQGSGVIVRPNIVATNCHVVDSPAYRIIVQKAAAHRANIGRNFSAAIRYADKKKDFCLLNVKNLRGMPAIVRKYDTLNIGENVYGLGAPQGLELSLSEGVISQLRKTRNARFIQTDAAISPGSSGGGLFDRNGNLLGILTAKITGKGTEGLGFAIPADLVLQ